jgi:hypothetical protein
VHRGEQVGRAQAQDAMDAVTELMGAIAARR